LAIAIRTYALKNRGRHAKDGYDFCTATHCQRFLGGDPTVREGANAKMGTLPDGRVSAAVRATEGQILTDDRGQPVDAYFGASCGGETANIAALWGTRPSQYLAGVRDEYCASGPHATWTDRIARADLLRALQSDARTNVGTRLDRVVISKRDETGRAEFITLEGEHRKQVRGWDFKIIVGRVLGWSLLKSSRFEVACAGSNFIFHGSGFGHGLGLCQEGAHVMAARGSTCQRILEKYFPGARVGHDREIGRKRDGETGRLGAEESARETYRADVLMRRSTNARVPLLPIAPSPHLGSSPRLSVSPSPRLSSLSSEHFRVTYPAEVDRRDATLVLNT